MYSVSNLLIIVTGQRLATPHHSEATRAHHYSLQHQSMQSGSAASGYGFQHVPSLLWDTWEPTYLHYASTEELENIEYSQL